MAINVSIKTDLEKKPGKPTDPKDRGMVTARPGQKPERRPPSSIKLPLIDGRRAPGLELLPFRSPQIQWRGTEGGNSGFFLTSTSDRLQRQERKNK